MDFSELSHQTEIRDSLDKILSEHCSQERLKKYDADFKHDEDLLSLLSTNGFLGLGLNENMAAVVKISMIWVYYLSGLDTMQHH